MAFADMIAELRGSVPKLPFPYTKTLINRAWQDVRESNLWSFQLFEGQWAAPPQILVNATTVIGSNVVTLDATSTTALVAALAAQPYSLITQRQFRIALSGIYNIWGWNPNGGGAGIGQLTLDRPYVEGATVGGAPAAMIFQCYYIAQQSAGASPQYLTDFRAWISVRNLQNFIDLYVNRYTRAQLDAIDPQRMMYFFPTDVVPYQRDTNPASSTLGAFLFELWGAPLSNYIYQLLGLRMGADLSALTDKLPFAVGEDTVMARARYYAYEWAEANRDLSTRTVGPDFKFLMKEANATYMDHMRRDRRVDRDLVDNWFMIRRTALPGKLYSYYNSTSGTAFPGVPFPI